MTEWKIIGLCGLINAALGILLIAFFYPLFFLGPLIGGFLATYLSQGYENREKMDLKDGAVVGAISGLIGGFIITILLILGFGAINTLMESISLKVEFFPGVSTIIAAYIILQLSLIVSLIMGITGGVIGVKVKS